MTSPSNADRTAQLISDLTDAGLTLAVAESLTGGAVVAELIRIPGASLVVRGGIVAYDTALKHSLLAVSAELLATHGPVHPDVAAAMAEGVRSALTIDGHPADIGLATTGVAGPDPQGGAPVGLVFVAVTDAAGTVVSEHRFSGDRAAIRAAAADAVLTLLADRLTTSS
ncbi:CinA family protein [Microcella sp.]|uniref:CinA family protein n=1 Tax=Microcella sp. TaxID=1913979 RepID=UPI00299F81D4|nr:CinA family protein [Microcella sp.]MDX2025927.1 CinA family protein [Microcella sp.]